MNRFAPTIWTAVKGYWKAVADATGYHESTIYRWGNELQGTRSIFEGAGHFVMACIRAHGDRRAALAPVDELEAALGRVAIDMPEPMSIPDAGRALIKTVEEFGDVARRGGLALDDGRVSLKEAETIRREVNELVRAALAFELAIRAKAEAGR